MTIVFLISCFSSSWPNNAQLQIQSIISLSWPPQEDFETCLAALPNCFRTQCKTALPDRKFPLTATGTRVHEPAMARTRKLALRSRQAS